MTDPAKQPVYDLADQFCRRLSAAGSRGRSIGHAQLAALESLVRAVPAGPFAADEQGWLRAYAHVEALLLTLSSAFEQAHDAWTMADLPERIGGVCASAVLAVAAVLLHPPGAATGRRVADDKTCLQRGTPGT